MCGRFLAGLVLGVLAGLVLPVAAQRIMGGEGYLLGWDVVVGGRILCTDPFVWPATREIECD